MKKLILGLVFIGLGIFSIRYFSDAENQAEDEFIQKIHLKYELDELESKVFKAVNDAKSVADLDHAEVMMQTLPKTYKDKIMPTVLLKKSSFWFDEAEGYLRKAIEIETAIANPMPEKPQEPRELHPLTTANLKKAFVLYEKVRKTCDSLKDTGDSDFDYHMNYLKGEIYYRILEFIADAESSQEIFNQILTYYKYALRSRNNDVNTVVNIEILIKNKNNLVGASPQVKRKQMLNSKKFGVGTSSGN